MTSDKLIDFIQEYKNINDKYNNSIQQLQNIQSKLNSVVELTNSPLVSNFDYINNIHTTQIVNKSINLDLKQYNEKVNKLNNYIIICSKNLTDANTRLRQIKYLINNKSISDTDLLNNNKFDSKLLTNNKSKSF